MSWSERLRSLIHCYRMVRGWKSLPPPNTCIFGINSLSPPPTSCKHHHHPLLEHGMGVPLRCVWPISSRAFNSKLAAHCKCRSSHALLLGARLRSISCGGENGSWQQQLSVCSDEPKLLDLILLLSGGF